MTTVKIEAFDSPSLPSDLEKLAVYLDEAREDEASQLLRAAISKMAGLSARVGKLECDRKVWRDIAGVRRRALITIEIESGATFHGPGADRAIGRIHTIATNAVKYDPAEAHHD